MSAEADPTLLDLYARELAYLRERGAEFAGAYPKVAGRLGISGRHCSDPHVERLLESFAFLTARVQSQLEQDTSVLTTALLGVLCPQYVSPLPPMAVACFEVDPKDGALSSGFTVSKGSMVFAEASQGHTCRFRTGYPVTLWPVAVVGAAFVPWGELGVDHSDGEDSGSGHHHPIGAIQLQLRSSHSLRSLGVTRLRFYINGDDVEGSRLYDLLFERSRLVLVREPGSRKPVSRGKVVPVGFGPAEDLLPYPLHGELGHRLVLEYFAFSRKFLFFDVEFDALPSSNECDLLIPVDRRPVGVSLRADLFRLGCTPIVNLFQQVAEPVTVDHRSFEYRLVADSRRERFTQIHSILEVTSTGAGEPEQRPFAPFFSFSHPNLAEGQARVFWTTRRLPNHRVDLPGSDVLLSFVDIDFHPRNPASDVLFARVLCTNRHLANEMEAGTVLALEQPAPVKRIECLTKPTPSVEPPSGGQALWRLVSNLSLNHLSIGGPQAVDAIREILRAYLFRASPSAERQIAAISSVRSRTVTGRVGTGGWRGPCRGTEVEIELDQPQFGDSSPLLFAEVLHRFLSLYAHLNSFTTLVLKSTLRQDEREEWKRWLPSAGAKPLL